MKNYLFVLLLLLSMVCQSALGQTLESITLPKLSKSEMYADFDTLTETISEFNPQIDLRAKITGIDILAELAVLRKRIEGIEKIEDFAKLIRSALTVCQDGHTSLLRLGYYPSDDEYLERGISTTALKLQSKYDSLLNSSLKQKKLNLQLRYINGEYINVFPFDHSGITIDTGFKLVKCNEKKIHQFVQGLYASKRMMRWDFTNSRWFSEDFFNSYDLKSSDTLDLTFLNLNNNEIQAKFCLKDSLVLGKTSTLRTSNDRKVEYFESEKILYIRMPKMEDGEYYFKKIQEIVNYREISKVVIDIRDNPGGSDFAWTRVLEKLIPFPIKQENLIICNDSRGMRARFPRESKHWERYLPPFPVKSKLAVFSKGESIILPDSSSLKFKGTIYIIQNENIYSSAGSLSAVGKLCENIVTIGASTGRLLGKGISPLLFELPNSKMMYRIEPVIDFMNVRSPEDVFHDFVEISAELSISQYTERLAEQNDLYSKNYLLNHDPVFKVVLLNK